ncbi:MAG: TraR/DksA family transcriptional regulator [Acidobacteria bacterium]|nr:TraR/DksA family transcriptional regulator [Acidobacteriota bacterium]
MSKKNAGRFQLTLEQIVENCDCHLRPEAVISSPDLDEQATGHHDQYVTVLNEEIRWRICDAARRALARLEEGAYGRCEECGEPISPKRLAAVPWADLCVACQARHEALDEWQQAA